MRMIRIGRHRLNLEYLIRDERGDGSPDTKVPKGVVRIVMATGEHIDLRGEDADRYLDLTENVVGIDPDETPFGTSSSTHLDPRTGAVSGTPRPRVKSRKKGS
jgi:hypothetical protein